MRRSARHLHLSNKKQAAVGKNGRTERGIKAMKAGRVSQTVYRRSVLKQIQNNIEGIDFLRPSQEETCYIADESEERITIATDVSLAGNRKRSWSICHSAGSGSAGFQRSAGIWNQCPDHAPDVCL